MDGSRIRKEKVADSKISGYVWTGPEASSAGIQIFVKVHVFLHESSFHPHETSESALQSGFLSLVYTDPDFKMCGFKNDFTINRRSMYQKNA